MKKLKALQSKQGYYARRSLISITQKYSCESEQMKFLQTGQHHHVVDIVPKPANTTCSTKYNPLDQTIGIPTFDLPISPRFNKLPKLTELSRLPMQCQEDSRCFLPHNSSQNNLLNNSSKLPSETHLFEQQSLGKSLPKSQQMYPSEGNVTPRNIHQKINFSERNKVKFILPVSFIKFSEVKLFWIFSRL